MSMEHDRLRQMILVLEDLDGADREAADEHLGACDSCRRLRERLLEVEAAGRDVDPLPLDDDHLDGLTATERLQARSSLSALVNRRTRRMTQNLKWIVPMAMAAALVMIALAPHLRRDGVVYDLRVGSPLVLRDATDAPAASRHGVSFRLRRPGHPVLVHVDGAGAGRLVHPLPGDPPGPLVADRLVLLPPPARGDSWRDGLAPGQETYLLAVSDPGSPPDQDALADLSTPEQVTDREETIRRLHKMLESSGLIVVRLNAPATD